MLLPGGGLLWNIASWFNTLFTAGSGSVAGAARSTALVVAVSAGSLTLATDRPPRERPRAAETPRKAVGPTPVLVATVTPDTLTFEAAGAPATAAGAGEPHGIVSARPDARSRRAAGDPGPRHGAAGRRTPSFDRSGEAWPRGETDGGASRLGAMVARLQRAGGAAARQTARRAPVATRGRQASRARRATHGRAAGGRGRRRAAIGPVGRGRRHAVEQPDSRRR